MQDQAPGRAPFVIAGAIAAIPLLVLAAGTSRGYQLWWLQYPRHITIIALLVALVVAFRRTPWLALLVPVATAAIAFVWELVAEYRGLAELGASHLLWREIDVLVELSVKSVAPWLMGGIYGSLAFLAIARARELRTNVVRAGAWLVVVSVIALFFTLQDRSWFTLENLAGHGTHVSGSPWPDTKQLSLAADVLACAAGAAAIAWALRRRDPIPRATLRKT